MKLCRMIAAMLLLMCLTACAPGVQEVPELLEPVGVEMDIVSVKRGEIYDMEAYEFYVAPVTEEVLYTTDGTIREMCVTWGQQVQPGDVLLRLDVEGLQEQLEELDKQISYTKKNNALTLQRMQLDVDQCELEMSQTPNQITYDTKKEQEKQDEYNRLTTALRQEKERQDLEMKQMNSRRSDLAEKIERSELKATASGSIVGIKNDIGDYVRASNTAVVLAQDTLQLKGEYISESVIGMANEISVLVGDSSCAVEHIPMDEKEYISLLLSGAQMYTCMAFAEEIPEGVQAGDYALVLIKTKQRENVLYLPVNAVERDAQSDYVFLKTADGGRERVNITVGVRTGTALEIEEGLQEGDEVYVP